MALQDDILKLADLDRLVVRAAIEADFDGLKSALGEYMHLRSSLDSSLIDQSAVMIESEDARAVFRRITDPEGLPADRVIRQLGGSPSDPGDRFDAEELQRLGEELFYSWMSHYDYVIALAELRPIVLRVAAPDAVGRLVNQIKSCYALQQYDAAYALCRSLIEVGIRDICIRKQLFPNLGARVVLLEERQWSELRRKVASGPLEERLRNLYADLSALIHGRRSVSRDEARRAFGDTLEIIEDLYAANGL